MDDANFDDTVDLMEKASRPPGQGSEKKVTVDWKLISNTVYDPFWQCTNCEFEINEEDFDKNFSYCPWCGKKIKYVEEDGE